MMAEHYAADDEISSTARMVRVLVEAGYDPSSDREMNMGLTAYNAALLVCGYASRKLPVHHPQKARAGRNDPCPCGSGKKYKKCCLDLDRAPSAANDRGPPIKFGPDVVPRLWGGDRDGDGLCEDYDRLSEIICQDPAFAGVGFPVEEVTAFMNTVADSEPAFMEALENDDPETYDAAFDAITTRFLKEHGADFDLSAVKDKCLEAAKRATSNHDLRALATGVCLALISDMSDDPADNPLATILFRKALFDSAGAVHIIDRIMNRFPDDAVELCRLMEANDPAINQTLEAAANELSPSALNALYANFDKLHGRLCDTITAGDFPVPLPLATQLAMFGRLYAAAGSETCSRDDMIAALTTSADDLIEEDCVQFSLMLDRWLKGNSEETSGRVAEAVRTMKHLCAIRSIGDLAPVLFINCLQERRQAPFDADELRFIEGAQDATDKLRFMAEYSAWLRTKGYPGMADRLVRCWKIDAAPRNELPDVERRIA
jgi:hypothetical protein